ncbi:MAG: nuclear transport factor 2 family protein [Clostridia bacterium]|nr:nuclear transport factor 2 family protein [Clostridia bacterium]
MTVLLGLMTVTFYYAMNLANVQVILKDGMALRARVVMLTAEESELGKYFQQSFLERDTALQTVHNGTSPYQNYNIRGIDHRLDMDFTWIWPWDESVKVDITERIPRIDGRAKGSAAEALVAQYGDKALYPPQWQAARYRVVLVKENGQWRIKSLTLLNTLAE